MHASCSSRELVEGICAPHARMAPKYLYDDLGCSLFELITGLPEYYPTRTELGLMERHARDLHEVLGSGMALIDLGAGSCRKARRLFPALRPSRYVAVDVSTDFVAQAVAAMRAAFPEIEMHVVGGDLSQRIDLPAAINGTRRVFFYPGSSIGNLDPEGALRLLQRICAQCGDSGGLLVGIDLVKDPATIHAAYNDGLGLTAAFNLNVLNHVNAHLGSDFRLSDWRHRAFYDAAAGRVEMHLDAVADVTVSWPDGQRRFRAGESIHTENSYKYRLEDFNNLLRQAGFRDTCAWTDERRWFAVCYAAA